MLFFSIQICSQGRTSVSASRRTLCEALFELSRATTAQRVLREGLPLRLMESFMDFVTTQVALLMKEGGCGVAAMPPHHTPHSLVR
jgi:hypothetical protein